MNRSRGQHIQGGLTLGENMADLAGLAVAYDAYHRSLNGKPAPVIDGMTGDQRFYLGYAQVWRSKFREPALRSQLLSDPHSPGPFRDCRGAQHRRMVCGVRRAAGRCVVPRAGGPRTGLVKPLPKI